MWNYTTLLEHISNGTDRLRFAPAERSGAAEGGGQGEECRAEGAVPYMVPDERVEDTASTHALIVLWI